MTRPIIEIYINGDPFGRGFEGSQSDDGGKSWYYRGDVGAQTREYWRQLARVIGAVLRYR